MLTLPDKECELITEQTTVREIRELKNMNKEAPEESEKPEERTPLQKCIIDFFKDKLELLDKISGMLDEKDVAEAIAPSGYLTHKKGIVFLFMFDYQKGVKYKLAGSEELHSLTWPEFYDEIHAIYFDHADEYKEHLSEIYPSMKPKEEPETKPEEPKEEPKAEPTKEEPETPGDIMPEPVSLSNLNITVENKAWKAALADAENVVHYIKLVIQEEDK